MAKGSFTRGGCFLSDKDFGKGGFALAVLADKGNPFAPKHLKINVFQDFNRTIALGQVLHFGSHFTTAGRVRETEFHRRRVHVVNLDALHFVQLLLHGLRHFGLRGFRHEPGNGALAVGNEALLVFVGVLRQFAAVSAEFYISGVGDFVVVDFSKHYFRCAVGYVVKEPAVVADHDNHTRVVEQPGFEP